MKGNADAVAIFIAIAVAAFLIFYGVRRRVESKRSEALRSVALSLGMSFEDGRNIDATQRFGPFHLFSQGSKKKVRNCLSGTIGGVDVTTFGYEYTVAGAESSSTSRQTVVVFRSNELSLPEFELRPKSIVETFKIVKIFKAFAGRDEDIKFDTRPDFSKSYYLGGKDESAIRDVFSRSVLEYFERHEGLSVEGRDESLLCYRGETLDTDVGFRGARVKPDELKLFLDEGRVIFDLFRGEDSPPHIKRETELKQAGTKRGSRIGNALAWIFAAIFSLLLLLIVALSLKNSGLWPF